MQDAGTVITEAEAASWLQQYGAAWESGDAECLLQLFTEDASYRETPFHVPMVGHEAIRAYWLQNPAQHIGVSFTFAVWAVAGNQCFAHWTSKFAKDERQLELDGAFRLVFRRVADRGPVCHTLEEWWHKRSRFVADHASPEGS